MDAQEDVKLVGACKKGDNEAFNTLCLKYQHRIFNTVMRLIGDHETACDITQETFLHAYQGIKKFEGKSSFFTWLFRIAINLAISTRRQYAQRKKHVRIYRDEDDQVQNFPEPASTEPLPHELLAQTEIQKKVQEAVQSLEEPFRTAIVLCDMEGLSYEEIQEILSCPIGTVRSRIHRARLMLKEKLSKFLET